MSWDMVELSTLSGLGLDFPVTATLADADSSITAGSVSWQWYKGAVTQQLLATLDRSECGDDNTNNCFIKGATSATYTPVADDVNDTAQVAVRRCTLTGVLMPADAKDFAMTGNSEPTLWLADTRNKAAGSSPTRTLEMDGVPEHHGDKERSVVENTKALVSTADDIGAGNVVDYSADSMGSAVNATEPDPNRRRR